MPGFPDRLAADLVRSRRWYLGLFLALFAAGACGSARVKPFWYDEVFTLLLARLDLSRLLEALRTGLEQNPPLYLLLERAMAAALGEGHVASRLISMAGVGLCSLCLLWFVGRRCGAVCGWVAALIPMFTEAYPYAGEARAYGLLLGSAGLALVCWQKACAGERRGLALAGLALSLAAAVSSHYYGVVILAPLAAGEMVRRKRDPAVWAAMALGAGPLLPMLALMRGARVYAAGFWAQPSLASLAGFWEFLLAPALWPAVLVLLAAVLVKRGKAADPEGEGPPRHEIAAVVTLALAPLLLLAMAFTLTNAWSDRYALPAVAGVAALAGFALHRAGARARAAVFLVLFGWFALRQAASAMLLFARPADPIAAHALVKGRDAPVAVANGVLFLQLAHYGVPVRYLGEAAAALRIAGTDSVDRALVELRNWAPIVVDDYAKFLAAHPRFFVYLTDTAAAGGRFQWLAEKLIADGWRLTLRERRGGNFLYEAAR